MPMELRQDSSPVRLLPGGAEVAQGTLNPLTLVRIQAGQPKLLVIGRPDEDTTMLQRDIS